MPRLLPGGEVSAPGTLVVVDEPGMRALSPAPRRLVEIIGNALTATGILTPFGSKNASSSSQ